MGVPKKSLQVTFGGVGEPTRGKYSLPVSALRFQIESIEEIDKLLSHSLLEVTLKVDGLSGKDVKGQSAFVQDVVELQASAQVKRFSTGMGDIRFTLKLDAEALDPRMLHAFTGMEGAIDIKRTGTIS